MNKQAFCELIMQAVMFSEADSTSKSSFIGKNEISGFQRKVRKVEKKPCSAIFQA